MIDPKHVALFIPKGLKDFKLALFNRIAGYIERRGGRVVRDNETALKYLPANVIPIVGASPRLAPIVREWRRNGRQWIGWDRGYFRRTHATWLPRGFAGGYYRWTLNAYQMRSIRDVPGDRWNGLKLPLEPWKRSGSHIVLAPPTKTYMASHACEGWIENTLFELAKVTDRQIVIRDKETKRPLQDDLRNAHCLVAHGSIAAVEAVILGTPVFVHADSAAALVGQTDLKQIESPIYPDREQWCRSLAYSQFTEQEMIEDTLWRLIQ